MMGLKRLVLLCSGLLGTSLVLAQEAPVTPLDISARSVTASPSNYLPINAYLEEGPPGATIPDKDGRTGDQCPAGSLCGQNEAGNTWLYSDLGFCSTTNLCRRVTSESFPPPSVPNLTQPIGIVSWLGTYINDATCGCTKAHSFRIEFYNDNGSGLPNCASPVVTFNNSVPQVIENLGTLNFGCSVPLATKYRFTYVLPSTVSMASGHFSIASDNVVSDCYCLLGPSASPEGDNLTWRWFELDTPCNMVPPSGTPYDIQYCFGKVTPGACCLDCINECDDDQPPTAMNDFLCGFLGGRFEAGKTCATMATPCTYAIGACCHEDNNCDYRTCYGCEYCRGDMNCDGKVDFGDINPFVLYLSNYSAWRNAYPHCNPVNGDINCDGTFPHLTDINPFVVLLGPPLPKMCPVRCDGDVNAFWGGPDTSCDAWPTGDCCTLVVPDGATLENEPRCQDEYDDTFNGGCNSVPAVFSPIACGQTIYGESGTFTVGGLEIRDTDWYRFQVTSPKSFVVSLYAEFDANLLVIHSGTCPDPNDPNSLPGYWITDSATGTKCTDITVTTRCLPAATGTDYYWIVVTPQTFNGVRCGMDYKVLLTCTDCDPCAIPACPPGSYSETSPCVDNPPASPDPNGGCNETPTLFEQLTDPFDPNDPNAPTHICGTTWARNGARDLDWYKVVMTVPGAATISNFVTEVPVVYSWLFNSAGGPPDCAADLYWSPHYPTACLTPPPAADTQNFTQVGTWFIMIGPSTDPDPIWEGYPCGLQNDYQFDLTVVETICTPCTGTHGFTEAEPGCGPGYLDTYNGGCDGPDTSKIYQFLTLGFESAQAWCSHTGTWLDPGDPNVILRDYDWYKFVLTANRRGRVLLETQAPMTWEIWPSIADPNNAANRVPDCSSSFGAIEGLDVTPCLTTYPLTVQCYPAGTYFLRVYPTVGTSANPPCGGDYDEYRVGLTGWTNCTVCNLSCTGAIDIDNSCDDVTDFDTNYGCSDPNETTPPTHMMTFACGSTYCGRCYATEINTLGYYDPDWYKITPTLTKKVKLTVNSEFLAHVALYLSCADYNSGSFIPGGEGWTAYSCPPAIIQTTAAVPANTPVYGLIEPADALHNLATKYYPCGHYNRWKIKVDCID